MQKLMSGDLGARSARLGQEAGRVSLIFSALVDPCSVGLDSSCSVTQVGRCFDLPTHRCTRHPHAHPHMFPRHAQVDRTGGISGLSHSSHSHLGPMLGPGDQSHPLCPHSSSPVRDSLSFPIGSTNRVSLNPLPNVKPQKGRPRIFSSSRNHE